jgi:hypothetical protein
MTVASWLSAAAGLVGLGVLGYAAWWESRSWPPVEDQADGVEREDGGR